MADSGPLMLSRSTDARISSMSILGGCAITVVSAVVPALAVCFVLCVAGGSRKNRRRSGEWAEWSGIT